MPTGLRQSELYRGSMMENGLSDRMLDNWKKQTAAIGGPTGTESKPDATEVQFRVSPQEQFQGQLGPDPAHHFPAINERSFGEQLGNDRHANMQGITQGLSESPLPGSTCAAVTGNLRAPRPRPAELGLRASMEARTPYAVTCRLRKILLDVRPESGSSATAYGPRGQLNRRCALVNHK